MGRCVRLGVWDEGDASGSREGAHRLIIEVEKGRADANLAQLAAMAATALQACNDGIGAGEHRCAGQGVMAEEHGRRCHVFVGCKHSGGASHVRTESG